MVRDRKASMLTKLFFVDFNTTVFFDHLNQWSLDLLKPFDHLKSEPSRHPEPNDLSHYESTTFDHLQSLSSSLRQIHLQTSNTIFIDILSLREGVRIFSIII
jgi:hypothetical protein